MSNIVNQLEDLKAYLHRSVEHPMTLMFADKRINDIIKSVSDLEDLHQRLGKWAKEERDV